MTATTTATTGATAAAWAWAAQTRAQRRARDASTSSLACAAAARTACPTAASVTSLSPAARRTHERELLRYDLGELCAQLRARGGVGVAAADDALPTFEHVAALPPNGHLGPGGRLCPPANYAYTGTERRSPHHRCQHRAAGPGVRRPRDARRMISVSLGRSVHQTTCSTELRFISQGSKTQVAQATSQIQLIHEINKHSSPLSPSLPAEAVGLCRARSGRAARSLPLCALISQRGALSSAR